LSPGTAIFVGRILGDPLWPDWGDPRGSAIPGIRRLQSQLDHLCWILITTTSSLHQNLARRPKVPFHRAASQRPRALHTPRACSNACGVRPPRLAPGWGNGKGGDQMRGLRGIVWVKSAVFEHPRCHGRLPAEANATYFFGEPHPPGPIFSRHPHLGRLRGALIELSAVWRVGRLRAGSVLT